MIGVPVSTFDELQDIKSLMGAIWMMTADLDEEAQRASIRRVVEVMEKRLQAVIDLSEKSSDDLSPA